MANTVIQLKYSTVTATPASLNVGEPAYSFTTNKLFIGNSTNHVLTIGGLYYTEKIDSATNAATGSTLVLRDATGNASFNYIFANIIGTIEGVASSALKLQTPRDIGLAGDATGNVSFDGSSNVTLTVDLSDTGVSAGTYGGSTKIPVFTVDAEGRLTSAANADVATTFSFAGDSGTGSLSLLTDTFTVVGRSGITSTGFDANNSLVLDVDNTVIRTTGTQTIDGDLTLNGNLYVQGNTVTYNVNSYVVNDPIVLFANNNNGNSLDLGFTAHYVADGNTRHTGLVKDVSAGKYYLFDNYLPHLQETHILEPDDASFRVANLVVNIVGGTISGLSSPIGVAAGGTGANTFSTGQLLVGNGTGALQSLANTGTAGTYANASHVPVITTDAYGRVSGVTNTAIAISASQITSGTLPIARGGTNQTSFSTGQMVIFDGTSLASIANSTYTLTGAFSTSNTITSLTVDAYGRVTAATGAAIAIAADQITTGTLGVARGGTGATTFTQNGVLLGQGTNAITTASSSTEGHILTINNSGVPTFQMLSGGTF